MAIRKISHVKFRVPCLDSRKLVFTADLLTDILQAFSRNGRWWIIVLTVISILEMTRMVLFSSPVNIF